MKFMHKPVSSKGVLALAQRIGRARRTASTNVETVLTHGFPGLGIVGLSPPVFHSMLLVFDIPFRAPDDEAWPVSLPSGGEHRFPTRHEAVKFAAREAARFTSFDGTRAYLSIEGADGVWRLFGADLKAPNL